MVGPDIITLRIDERLIHGQRQPWIKTLEVDMVIVANDSASGDPMQQTLMKAVAPKIIVIRSFSVRHTCGVVMRASPKQTIFIMCKTTGDALKLVAGGVPVKEINVDNIHRAPGKEDVSKYIALGEDDKTVLRKIWDQYRAAFNTEATTPGNNRVAKVDPDKYSQKGEWKN